MAEPIIKVAKAADIFAVWGRRPIEPFDIPGAGRVWVQGLTDLELSDLYDKAERDPDQPGRTKDPYFRAKFVQRSVVDGAGKPVFGEGDVLRIAGANRLLFADLIALCEKLSAIGGAADAEILKNFVATLTSGS
jgi:hypothetical protein